MTRDDGDLAISAPPPPYPIPDWRRVEHWSSQFIPDWRALQRLGLNWRGVERNIAALCLYLQPSTHPLPPMYTQFHPRSPNPGAPDTRGFRVMGVEGTQELAEGRNPKKTKRNGIPVADFALPDTKYLPIAILLHPFPSVTRELVHPHRTCLLRPSA
jgi:hypothetical protein